MREIIDFKDIEKELKELTTNEVEDEIYICHKLPLVFRSKKDEVDDEYCVKNSINVIQSFNWGGTIVANSGDIDMAIFRREGWGVGKKILYGLGEYLVKKYNLNVAVDGNDLIIDGLYKVCSYASINANRSSENALIYTCVHLSFNPHVEMIDKICTKPMVKIPRGLGYYGIDQNEILEEVSRIVREL